MIKKFKVVKDKTKIIFIFKLAKIGIIEEWELRGEKEGIYDLVMYEDDYFADLIITNKNLSNISTYIEIIKQYLMVNWRFEEYELGKEVEIKEIKGVK